MIMVDELKTWPGAKHPFDRGSCHMTTDGAIDDLHAFAKKIGLRREWFQPHVIAPHYDLSPKARDRAIVQGAVFVGARAQVLLRRGRGQGLGALIEKLEKAR